METRRKQTGLTLVELIITIAIIGILTGMAAPSFQASINRSRVRGARDELFADLQYAKSEAIKRSTSVSVITTAGSPWSYCVTTTDCVTAANVLKTVTGTAFPNTTLDVSATVTFNFLRGTANQQTYIFTGNVANVNLAGITNSVTVTPTGRISIP